MSDLSGFKKILLSGELNVRSAAETQSTLLASLRANRSVQLDCTQVSDVDLTFVQLLLAARKSASASGVQISLTYTDDGPLDRALQRAGLGAAFAKATETDRAFWSSQAKETADGQDHPDRR